MKYTLSIVMPVYNEEENLDKILKKVEGVKLEGMKKEIILVDDCSKDKSREVLKKYAKKYKVILHEFNQGKGGAVRTGIENATGDIIIIQDTDLEYDPQDYPAVLKPIREGKTQVVYGSRFLNKNADKGSSLHHLGNVGLSMITRILFWYKITDMETCYKVFTKEAIMPIKIEQNRFGLEPELTAKFLRHGHKIKEVPIHYYPRDFSQGKKITWKDGVKAATYLVKYRFKKLN